jgi:hypothetical protein
MCTLSLLPQAGGYQAWMNRDEAPERGAQARRLADARMDGLNAAYPVDGPSGGTWLGVNAAGLLLALLNQYPQPAPARAPLSRGTLIPQALGQPDAASAARRLRALDPAQVGPCLLVLAGPGQPTLSLRWKADGWALRDHGRGPLLFASSGVDAVAAEALRRAQFEAALPGGAPALEALHRSHQGGPGPLSVCMHRGASRSVSLTRVSAGPEGSALDYWPWPPCEAGARPPLSRRLAPSAP